MRWFLLAVLAMAIVLPRSAEADEIDLKGPKAKVQAALLQRLAGFADVDAAKRFLTAEGFTCSTTDSSVLTRMGVLKMPHLYCKGGAGGPRWFTVWHVGILRLHDGIAGVVVLPETIYM